MFFESNFLSPPFSMAGQSAKKLSKQSSQIAATYKLGGASICLVHLAGRLYFYSDSILTVILAAIFTCAIAAVCVSMIVQSASMGMGYE